MAIVGYTRMGGNRSRSEELAELRRDLARAGQLLDELEARMLRRRGVAGAVAEVEFPVTENGETRFAAYVSHVMSKNRLS